MRTEARRWRRRPGGAGGGMGGAGGGMGGAGGGVGGAGGACASIKINEVQVATWSALISGSSSSTICTTPVDLSGYRLAYRAAQALIDTTVVNFAVGRSRRRDLLVGSYDPNGTRDTTFAYRHLAPQGVGLRNPAGTLVVPWATAQA